MSIEPHLTESLSKIGYFPVKRYVYKASWGTGDVEHFLMFKVYGFGQERMHASFGLRNPQSEQFSMEAIKKYGGSPYEYFKYDKKYNCTTQYSVGRISGWAPRSSLKILGNSKSDAANRATLDINKFIFPHIINIESKNDLFETLAKDVDPFRWVYVNGAIRAAQVIFLGKAMGMDVNRIRDIIAPHMQPILAQLHRAENPLSYIDSVIADAPG